MKPVVGSTTTTISRQCPICGKVNTITVDTKVLNDGMQAYRSGALIQNAFPTLSPSEREFFITGICDKCWDAM